MRRSAGKESKPSLELPGSSWHSIDLNQFDLVPKFFAPMLHKVRRRLGTFHHRPRRIGKRLSLRLRILHGHRILRRLDPLPH